MIRHASNQIYAVASGKSEYTRHKRLLTSKAFTIDAINQALLVNGGKQVVGQKRIYVPLDESEIRKPETYRSEDLMRVRDLKGYLVNGYRTINTIAVSEDGKTVTLLETKPFTSVEKTFVSENIFKQEIIRETTTALRRQNKKLEIVYLLDRGFDDQKIMESIIGNHSQFVLRVSHTDRLVSYKGKRMKLEDVPLQKGCIKAYQKLTTKSRTYQDVVLTVSYASVLMNKHTVCVLKIVLTKRNGERVFTEPFYLLTNQPVKNPETDTYAIFKSYILRWKIEGVFQFLKDTIGWESFRVRDLKSIKHIIALTYLVGAYFYEIGEGLISQEFIEFIARLGRGKGIIGKKYLKQGLQDIIGTITTLKAFKGWDPKDIVRLYTELGYGKEAEEIFLNKGGAS